MAVVAGFGRSALWGLCTAGSPSGSRPGRDVDSDLSLTVGRRLVEAFLTVSVEARIAGPVGKLGR
jgi:hypothetical protein